MTKWDTLTESEKVHFVKLAYINHDYGDKVKKYGYVAGKVNDPKTGEQNYLEQYQRLSGNVQQMERLLENIYTQLNKYTDTVAPERSVRCRVVWLKLMI